ncbi:hypothetical protein GQ457_05G031080 [Hibiscus cannabinus]
MSATASQREKDPRFSMENPDGSPEDPPVFSPKVKLNDDIHIVYRERGVPKAKSNCKIIIVCGFGSSKDMNFQVPQELIEELGIYFLLYDRVGYGESDLNPRHPVKSEALDLQELVDQLWIGPKFYVIGVSMGGWMTSEGKADEGVDDW